MLIPTAEEWRRLFAKVEVQENGCWQWVGAVTPRGYGNVRLRSQNHRAYRLMYELLMGDVPEGLELDHLCHNPGCVNPVHLEPVTHRENCRRGRGGKYLSERTHCDYGHPFSPENTYRHPRGRRVCRICARDANRRLRARKKRGLSHS